MSNTYKILVIIEEITRRSRRILEDNIKVDTREIASKGLDWINLAKDRDGCRLL
jgi:hypothetical protein